MGVTPSVRDREMAQSVAMSANAGLVDEIAAALAQARAEEREACAGLVTSRPWWEAAAAIRARGEEE